MFNLSVFCAKKPANRQNGPQKRPSEMGQNGINKASQTSKGEFCCPDQPLCRLMLGNCPAGP